MLSRKRRSTSTAQVVCSLANTYTLIATPLERDVSLLPEVERPNAAADQPMMALPEPPSYYATPPKTSEAVEVTNQTLSPPLSNVGERGSSIGEGSSRGNSFSVPRIEDSLEELDRLEEDLEAFNTVTNGRRVVSPAKNTGVNSASPASTNKITASKRVSVAGQFATVQGQTVGDDKTCSPSNCLSDLSREGARGARGSGRAKGRCQRLAHQIVQQSPDPDKGHGQVIEATYYSQLCPTW